MRAVPAAAGEGPAPAVLGRDGLDRLLDCIRRRGFRLVGPLVEDGAICYGDISSAADLPAGWTDEQDAAAYRLRRRDDQALFGYNVGPQSWKKYLFPAVARLGAPDGGPPERFAFIGVRACELHAIAIQDRVFTGGQHADPGYAANRDGAFIVAVNCGQAARTCFCVSMSAGPRAEQGFDLALTELLDGGGHRFLVEAGTPRGAEVLAGADAAPAAPGDVAAADAVVARTAAAMGRSMPELDLRDLLYDNLEHPRWDDVAGRCLACGNCTMVCPTCFCFSVEEVTDLAGAGAQRQRSWDSCFTLDHSWLHGGPVRTSNRSRYRQWLTHKLATWQDQFGTSGCVGCGRCITWCPAGIDITEEVAAIAADT
ncbi:MAG TPA: 4Fe-4S dicluster domain-containing protein [Streptosporangiaceae bacterium]|nr:4Fe-4S dicluster domain-containing protein [Streptosporangiaceae bacterium]